MDDFDLNDIIADLETAAKNVKIDEKDPKFIGPQAPEQKKNEEIKKVKEIIPPKKPKKSRFGKLRRPDDYVSVINRIQGTGLIPKKRSRSRSVGYRRHSMKKKKSRFGPGL